MKTAPTPARTGSKIFRRTHDPIWHLQLGVLIVIALQAFTDPALLPYNKYLLIVLELVLVAMLALVTPDAYHHVSKRRRVLALTLIGVVAFGNIISLILLLQALMGGQAVSGLQLLQNTVAIYVANVFMFALFYWEMDGGGPDKRATGGANEDFMFTQMAHPRFAEQHWLPGFTDYLYLSATNVTNFASADTVPLSHRAKMIMMTQSIVSVIIVVLVAARAVSILQ